jgi:hypothetical protein
MLFYLMPPVSRQKHCNKPGLKINPGAGPIKKAFLRKAFLDGAVAKSVLIGQRQ